MIFNFVFRTAQLMYVY